MENEINPSYNEMINDVGAPGAEGDDVGVGKATDFGTDLNNALGPESKPVTDEDAKLKKDTSTKKPKAVMIGAPADTMKKEKKGFLKRLFGRKDKDE